jgi:hypothetical protein
MTRYTTIAGRIPKRLENNGSNHGRRRGRKTFSNSSSEGDLSRESVALMSRSIVSLSLCLSSFFIFFKGRGKQATGIRMNE